MTRAWFTAEVDPDCPKDLKGLTDDDISKLWSRIDRRSEDECWPWLGAVTHKLGYGIFNPHVGVAKRPYRVTYTLLVGPIPAGLVIDHLCRNPNCVNPNHLEPVTHRQNLHRSAETQVSINAAKTHCPQGHEYAGDNLVLKRTSCGHTRQCLTCRRRRDREGAARRRKAAKETKGQTP